MPRRKRSGPNGISVTVRTDAPKPTETRYARALRRQAANRARRKQGEEPLPEVRPGRCMRCRGWGVLSRHNLPCPDCEGTGG